MYLLIGLNRHHNTCWKRWNRSLAVRRGRRSTLKVLNTQSMRNQSQWDLKIGKNTLVLRLVGIRMQLARRVPWPQFGSLSNSSKVTHVNTEKILACLRLPIRLFTMIHKHETLISPPITPVTTSAHVVPGLPGSLAENWRRGNSGEQLLALLAAFNTARPSRCSRITFSGIARTSFFAGVAKQCGHWASRRLLS